MKQQPLYPYPRKRISRFLITTLGKMLLPTFFNVEKTGMDNFPPQGPCIVVGNHTAAMEAVLMNIYAPWQIEMLSAADLPAEPITEVISKLYGVIPLHRGAYDRRALQGALGVLEQGGVLGLFPEGGIWEEGKMKAQRGVAWLSYRGDAPVLPIGFNDTTGALNDALNLKRPELKMVVGDLIPPVDLDQEKARKVILQDYADQVMEAVHRLAPIDRDSREAGIKEERFSLAVRLLSPDGEDQTVPEARAVQHGPALAKFFHRPAILKIFRENLNIDTTPLETLAARPSPRECIRSLQAVLEYLQHDNPYLLTYRFGTREGLAMQSGLVELLSLLRWADEHSLRLEITPIRRYYSVEQGKEIIQREQEEFTAWM